MMQLVELFETEFAAYHGTKTPIDFAAFRVDLAGSANPTYKGQKETPAIWASQSPKVAHAFADADPHGHKAEPNARIIPVIVHMTNPLIVDMEADKDAHRSDKYFNHPRFGRIWNISHVKEWYLERAKRLGHDGVIFKHGYDGWMDQGDLYAVFSPTQIRMKFGQGDGEYTTPAPRPHPQESHPRS